MANLTIILGIGAALLTCIISFFVGRHSASAKLREVESDLERTRAFIENAGIDFTRLRRLGQQLTQSASVITTAAAEMVNLADNSGQVTKDAKALQDDELSTSFAYCGGRRNGNHCGDQLYRCSKCNNVGCRTYGSTHCTNEKFHDGQCMVCRSSTNAPFYNAQTTEHNTSCDH